MKEATEAANIDNPVFILDNARIYHYGGLQKNIKKLNLGFEYIHHRRIQPKHCLSPAIFVIPKPHRKCFSVWKDHVLRGGAWSKIELKKLISSKFTEITRVHCNGFCRKMLRYIVKSERQEIIIK